MMLLLMFVVGVAVGGGLTFWMLALWVDSQNGRRRLAVMRAEHRVRDAQAAAFTRMAEVAEDAVHQAAGGAVPSFWPSDSAVGTDVDSPGEFDDGDAQ